MKKLVLYKVATVMTVLAIGGVTISHEALARGGGGGGGFGMGGGGGHFGDGGHFDGGDFHGGPRGAGFVTPLFGGDTVITGITTRTAGALSTGVASGSATDAKTAPASCMMVRLASATLGPFGASPNSTFHQEVSTPDMQ